jgi:hypothetical protein
MKKRKSKQKADKSQVADRLRILCAIVDQFPVRALYVQVACSSWPGSVDRAPLRVGLIYWFQTARQPVKF